MNIIQQVGSLNTALEVIKQAQGHVLAPTVYVTSLNECFAYMPASEAMADNQVIWIADLKAALMTGVAA